MKIHDFEQGSKEWLDIRKLKLTASNAAAIATAGKGLDTLCFELVADYFSLAEKENYINTDIERGNELEEEARMIYTLERGECVSTVGFVELDKYSGCSPDGLVGDDGLVEIKCYNDKNYIKYLVDRQVESKYRWQMQMQMLVTGRKWCDFVVYNHNFNKSLCISRFKVKDTEQEKIKIGLDVGKKKLVDICDKINIEMS